MNIVTRQLTIRMMLGRTLGGLMLIGLMGCGGKPSGPARYEVSGAATYDGKPIPEGTIYFEPDASQGNSGPGSLAIIHQGTYRTSSGAGVIGGPYLVRVNGNDGVTQQLSDGTPAEGKPLFKEKVLSIDLPKEKTVHDIAVPVK